MAEWRKAGYQEQEGYENFATLLDAPKEDAKVIENSSLPFPSIADSSIRISFKTASHCLDSLFVTLAARRLDSYCPS